MNEIKVFENKNFGTMRTLTIDGEPWFVGKDVAQTLGYKNPNEAIGEHVDCEDKLNSKTLSSIRVRLIQPYPIKQTPNSKGVQALDYIRGVAIYPQTRCIYDTRNA